MEGPLPGYDFLAPWLAHRVGAIPQQLQRRIVGFRAGVREEYLAHRTWRHRDELLGQVDQRIESPVEEGMVEWQLFVLGVGGCHETRLAETNCHRPQYGHAFDVASSYEQTLNSSHSC